MKTRLCVDSVTATDLPARLNPPLALAYLDGNYGTDKTASPAAVRRRLPGARIATVTVNGSTPGAAVIDRETGDATAATAASYALATRRGGGRQTVYTYLSGVPEVCTELVKLGLGRDDVLLFTAHYTGKPHICGRSCLKPYRSQLPFVPRVIGTQYADPATSGGHFDLSLVDAGYWPGVDPAPVHPLTARHRWMARRLTVALDKRVHPLPIGDRLIVTDLGHAATHAATQK